MLTVEFSGSALKSPEPVRRKGWNLEGDQLFGMTPGICSPDLFKMRSMPRHAKSANLPPTQAVGQSQITNFVHNLCAGKLNIAAIRMVPGSNVICGFNRGHSRASLLVAADF